MVGPIVETGYERMCNTLKVSNTTNDSEPSFSSLPS